MDDYLAPYPEDPEEVIKINRANWWRGLLCCSLFLCAFAYLNPYHLDFFNPMQRFWRVISMLSTIYFCFLIIMLHHRPSYGRELLGFLDPALGGAIDKSKHTYDDDCELTWDNFKDNLDHYYLVHLVDWFLASFVIRDFYILHFWHVLDEVIELSWQHILPHFRECWWDHLICDILLSNIPAITFGLWLQRKLGMMTFDYWGKTGKNGKKKSFWEYDVWHCHKRFGIMVYMQIILNVWFLCNFFLMNAFLIPPVHGFPIFRLLMWFALGSIGFREGYEDASTWNTPQRKHQAVEGRYRWLAIGIMCTEVMIVYKYRKDTGHINEDVHTPFYIWFPWVAWYSSMILYWVYLRFKPGHTTKYPVETKNKKVKHH